MSRAVAIAHANIALIKYWGKSDREKNLPAVPSLSLTLSGLQTRTLVELAPKLSSDHVELDHSLAEGRPRDRVVAVLNQLRQLAGESCHMRVASENHFPTAAGLASSASGFAALSLAAAHALNLNLTEERLSGIARAASASASRSIFGGWVELPAGGESARQVAPRFHLDCVMLVAVTKRGPKPIGSTEAMLQTAATSPYYPAWVDAAPAVFERGKAALLARNLAGLGRAMEHSTLLMHASMLGADPAILYLAPTSIAVMDRVKLLRQEGVDAYFTMDAGPHVKVLTASAEAERVQLALSAVPGVLEVLRSEPGPAAEIVEAA